MLVSPHHRSATSATLSPGQLMEMWPVPMSPTSIHRSKQNTSSLKEFAIQITSSTVLAPPSPSTFPSGPHPAPGERAMNIMNQSSLCLSPRQRSKRAKHTFLSLHCSKGTQDLERHPVTAEFLLE